MQKSYGKISRLDFCDQGDILLIDYLAKSQTINEEYYSFLLMQLKDILKEQISWNLTKVVSIFYDHAPALWSVANQNKLADMGFHYLDHQTYSSILVPSNDHLFRGLKMDSSGNSYKTLQTKHLFKIFVTFQ
jgi:hypothetical protein